MSLLDVIMGTNNGEKFTKSDWQDLGLGLLDDDMANKMLSEGYEAVADDDS